MYMDILCGCSKSHIGCVTEYISVTENLKGRLKKWDTLTHNISRNCSLEQVTTHKWVLMSKIRAGIRSETRWVQQYFPLTQKDIIGSLLGTHGEEDGIDKIGCMSNWKQLLNFGIPWILQFIVFKVNDYFKIFLKLPGRLLKFVAVSAVINSGWYSYF